MLDAYPESRLARVLLWSFGALVLAFLILPTLIVVPISFSASDMLEFPPRSFSLRWYSSFFGSADWMAALRTSLILAGLTAAVSVPAAFLTCVAMHRLSGRIARAIYTFAVMPSVVPGILLAIGLFFVLAKLRLLGTLGGVLLGHVVLAIPVAVIVLYPSVRRFDWVQLQAARSLGAGWGGGLVGIMLPQMTISLVSAALMAFLSSLDEAVISIFVSGGANTTLPKLMFISLRDQIDPTIAAISTLWTGFVIAVVLVFAARQKP
ncbi:MULTISPECIES: ABC transporter permease [unclassified Mesorhizobium]|uniref:ABC transporter permease n=1 Tax=unclassified Mesorhizobium TaxID=325217 RepID=UPI000FC99796|nr:MULTISPECIES: ABC transporter permease [unclassified Mesorhizobium]TGP22937.1 ABC transporter permease [Mesorhizobium sp. M1D.F.Ca.ET.231.01.1.1]TGP31999.1 ABC transporter permease [Mesorhizobium sp. M1D.F.Ca.ET.234.01.1.1]TGS46462.1 ABC transporter permease [Mesorhizobium sp. M1D.F.Ca.ET.184.01.1.1]TGS61289.1 ABC transporter permease [Mesorhizobium sp. M1D.F.Ca.ET.183.01.1.1]